MIGFVVIAIVLIICMNATFFYVMDHRENLKKLEFEREQFLEKLKKERKNEV